MPGGKSDLNVSPGCLHILLVGGVSGLSPVAADGDGNCATLTGAVHVIVQVPGLGMCLYEVVASNVGAGARPNRDSWEHTHGCQ